MNFSILKHIKCPNKTHTNFEGEYEFTSFLDLEEVIVNKSIWRKGISKQDLPLFCCTTFKNEIKADKALPTSLFALDFDDEGNSIEKARAALQGYGYYLYTSYSHTEDHPKFRIIIQLDVEIISNDESHMVFEIIQEDLAKHGLILDRACKDISRRFFLPSLNKQNEYPITYCEEGEKYKIEHLLEQKYNELISLDQQKETNKVALEFYNAFVRKKKKSKKIDVDAKIEAHQHEFLLNPSNQNLGKLVNALLFWEMPEHEILSWCVNNYHPSTGNVRAETQGWINNKKKKNNETYTQKYGI